MYDEVKALVGVISEDENDYPCLGAYRMVMDKLAPVKDELAVIEESRKVQLGKQELDKRRSAKADDAWEDADLLIPSEDHDDVHIESDGWAIDGKHYSRVYYVSINGAESTKHTFSVTFVEDSDVMESVNGDTFFSL
jgi:hypothetical protein